MMKKYILFSGLVAMVFLACEKNSGYIDPSADATGARVKFIHTSWNGPSFIFYGKDTTLKFSAATPTSSNIPQGTAFGGVYPSLGYALLPPYNDSIKIRVPSNSTISPDFFKAVGKLNVEEGKYYSVFVLDSFPEPTTLILNDTLKNFNQIGDSMYQVRFVNALYGSPAVDIYSKRNNAVIFSSVNYKAHTQFKELKMFPSSDTLELRHAGTTTVIARLNGFSPGNKKIYTWFSRGKMGATTPAPSMTFYTNQ